jgi:hypothetical protein
VVNNDRERALKLKRLYERLGAIYDALDPGMREEFAELLHEMVSINRRWDHEAWNMLNKFTKTARRLSGAERPPNKKDS